MITYFVLVISVGDVLTDTHHHRHINGREDDEIKKGDIVQEIATIV